MTKRLNSTPSVRKRREELKRKQQQQNKMIKTIGGILLAVVIAFVAWQLLSPDDSGGEGTVVAGERPLAALDPAARDGYYDAPPENILEPGVDYQAIIRTEKGEMRLDLYEDEAPLTVNNFVFLANQGFYDGTTFHRVLQDFMAQGGDPSGTGAGGPGYEFADETDNGLGFDRRGLLAMANGGPNTNGSQFFITFGVTDWLDGNHTIFGELIEGDDVLSSLALRDPASATEPGEVIERIDIVEN